MTLTREGLGQQVSLYVNGVPAGTSTDDMPLYVIPAFGGAPVYFLMDNTSGGTTIEETSPGVLSYLQCGTGR